MAMVMRGMEQKRKREHAAVSLGEVFCQVRCAIKRHHSLEDNDDDDDAVVDELCIISHAKQNVSPAQFRRRGF